MKERIEKVLKNKRLILTILIGIAFTISISYAIYNIVLQGQKPHQITTSKLSFSYKEPLEALDLLVSKALTDDEGKAQDNYYEFTVKAESDAAEVIDYVIYLQQLETEKNFLPSDIKVYFYILYSVLVSFIGSNLIGKAKTEKKKKDWKDIEYQTTLRQVQKA